MANFITWLKDRKKQNTIVPKTMTKAVYDDNGVVLSDILSGLADKQVTNAQDTSLTSQTYHINANANVFWISASYGYNTFPIGMAFRNGSDDLKKRALQATVVNTNVIVTFDFDNNTVTTDRGTGSVANDLYVWIVPITL